MNVYTRYAWSPVDACGHHLDDLMFPNTGWNEAKSEEEALSGGDLRIARRLNLKTWEWEFAYGTEDGKGEWCSDYDKAYESWRRVPISEEKMKKLLKNPF